MKKRHYILICLIIVLSLTCTGCGNLFFRVFFGSDHTMESGETTPEDPDESTEAPTLPPESTEPTTEAPPAIPEGYLPTNDSLYTSDGLNLRSAPSTDAEILMIIPAGAEILRIADGGEWSYIRYRNQTAYVASRYLTAVPPTLSNDSRYFGYDRNGKRDEKNVPVDLYWYDQQWGHVADFLQDTEQNVIYLTMDEGYESGNTAMILDILKEKEVTAVFFLTKGFVDSSPELVQRMIDEGHILGNHTCSHPSAGMPSLSDYDQREDILKLHNMVLEQFGYEMKLFRYPAGIFSDHSLQLVSSLGYRSVFWSFAHRDFEINNQPDPDKSLALCLKELHPGAIYLLHAVSDTNTQILADFIDAVRERGYSFGVYPVE